MAAAIRGDWLIEEIPPNAADWRALNAAVEAHRRFLATSWFDGWGESFLPDRRWQGPVRYFAVREPDGRLVGAFPYAIYRLAGFGFLCGAGYYWPYRGLPFTSDAAARDRLCDTLSDFLSQTLSARSGLRLGPVCADDPAVDGLLSALSHRGWYIGIKQLGSNFVVDLPGSVDAFNALNAELVKKVRYYERRMRRSGAVRIEKRQNPPGRTWNQTLADLAQIEANSWVGKQGGDCKFGTLASQRFWQGLLQEPFFAEHLSAWILHFDGQPVSFSFNLDCGDQKFILANNYDEAVRIHSTGWILAYHLFEDAIAHKIKRVDWGQGDSGYKQKWGAVPARKLLDCLAFAPGPVGYCLARTLAAVTAYNFRGRSRLDRAIAADLQ